MFSRLRWLAPASVTTLCLAPLIVGVLALLLPSFGYLPALGQTQLSLAPWLTLWQMPALAESILSTIAIALCSTLLVVVLTLLILTLAWGRRGWRLISGALIPSLALPHVAFTIGLAFLLAPSGWLARALLALGRESATLPLALTGHAYHGLVLLLVIKAIPFMLLMAQAVLSQINPQRQLLMAASLGYSRSQIWFKVLLPQLYPKLRLAIFSVLVYSMTVVDAALLIGPSQPPVFAVSVYQWFLDPALAQQTIASAGALLLLGLTLLVMGAWRLAEVLLLPLFKARWLNGQRQEHKRWLVLLTPPLLLLSLLSFLAPLALLIWSFAARWRFPALLPTRWQLSLWQEHLSWLGEPLWQALQLGAVSALLALTLAVIALEYQHQCGRYWPLLLPCFGLLMPAVSLLMGLQITFTRLGLPLWGAVLWGHLLMVFPYVYLSLQGPYSAFDGRYQMVGLTLGRSPWQVWWQIKYPLLRPAFLGALAVGFGVSIVQYLPTVLLSGGRIATITTEAVSVGAGHDRRLAALYGLLQAALPLLAFAWVAWCNRSRPWSRNR